jgi:pyruvate,water dikinase
MNAVKDSGHALQSTIQRADIRNSRIAWHRRIVVYAFLRWSKASIRRREETRFRRTLISGFARKVFRELGKRYAERNVLASGDDIFYLTLEEILEGTMTDGEHAMILVQKRKDSLRAWADIELPRRIETELSIDEIEALYRNKAAQASASTGALQGMVVSTGGMHELSGTALVMKEFNPTADFAGKIVVTSHTDPGWSLVFPFIAGLVVERGGMLSHAAIVARELGIPCIVGVEEAAARIATNDAISLDLKTGEVSNV